MATQIPDKTLQAALAEVEAELAEMAKAEKESALKKAREESAGSGSPAGSPSASGSPSAEASAGGEAPPSAPGGEAPPADPNAPPADASAPTADPSAPPADPNAAPGAMPTLEQIVAEYSKLPPEELKLYYLGIKTALAQASGMGGSPTPMAPGAAPSAAPSAPSAAPGPSAPPMPPMGKSESEKVLEASLKKSEAKQAEIEKDLATLSKALEMVIGQPQRKGVTGIEYVRRAAPAPEPEQAAIDPSKLSKSEMNLKLRHAVRSGKLSKSQMENVSKFSEGGMKDLDLVKDLFAVPTK